MTIASLALPADWNLEAIAAQAGNGEVDGRWYRDGILYVSCVSQADLEQAAAKFGEHGITFAEAVAQLNTAYQADVAILRDAHAGAALAGGANQATKQAVITTQFTARKAKFLADSAALKAKYGA